MIPSQLAEEVAKSLNSLIRTEFQVASSFFLEDGVSIVEKFLQKPEALIKGPWAQIFLPFAVDKSYENIKNPSDSVPPFSCLKKSDFGFGFPPYAHQAAAFERLCGETPQSRSNA